MKKCFVISPIGEKNSEVRKNADDALKYIIEPVCKSKGYEAIRADQISDAGMITQSIIEHILKDDIAIIDITDRNPNVFYELAIRHSFGLPAIQITRDDMSSIPFDVHNVRTIQYDLTASGADKAKQDIEKAIDSIEAGTKTSNPVSSVAQILHLTAEATSGGNDAVLSELLLKVNSIPAKLETLESNIGVRFSQMLTAFGESIKTSSTSSSNSPQDLMLQKLFETLMTNPEQGLSQMENLMSAQELMQKKGYIK